MSALRLRHLDRLLVGSAARAARIMLQITSQTPRILLWASALEGLLSGRAEPSGNLAVSMPEDVRVS